MAELVSSRGPAFLDASSALGSASTETPRVIIDIASVSIIEEPFLNVTSLRNSRIHPGANAAAALAAWRLESPAQANGLSGTVVHGCAWIEPRAWIIASALPGVSLPAVTGVLATDISDRFAIFRLKGAGAVEVISAGCDPAIVPVGRAARTRFASLANALIQCWSADDFRIMVDVSIGETFADWLRQTGSNARQSG